MSTSQRAVTPCVWGVQTGMVRVWVTYLSVLEIKELYLIYLLTVLYFAAHPCSSKVWQTSLTKDYFDIFSGNFQFKNPSYDLNSCQYYEPR